MASAELRTLQGSQVQDLWEMLILKALNLYVLILYFVHLRMFYNFGITCFYFDNIPDSVKTTSIGFKWFHDSKYLLCINIFLNSLFMLIHF